MTRTVRGIRSEVPIGADEGLPDPCVISCDSLVTLPKGVLEGLPVGHLSPENRAALDRSLRYALDIQF